MFDSQQIMDYLTTWHWSINHRRRKRTNCDRNYYPILAKAMQRIISLWHLKSRLMLWDRICTRNRQQAWARVMRGIKSDSCTWMFHVVKPFSENVRSASVGLVKTLYALTLTHTVVGESQKFSKRSLPWILLIFMYGDWIGSIWNSWEMNLFFTFCSLLVAHAFGNRLKCVPAEL